MKTPKGYCEQCQLLDLKLEVLEATGLDLVIRPYGKTLDQGYMAAAFDPRDEDRTSPPYHAYGPTKLEAAKALVEAMRYATFA